VDWISKLTVGDSHELLSKTQTLSELGLLLVVHRSGASAPRRVGGCDVVIVVILWDKASRKELFTVWCQVPERLVVVWVVNLVLSGGGEKQNLLDPRRLIVNLLPALADTIERENLANGEAQEDVLHEIDVGENLGGRRLGAGGDLEWRRHGVLRGFGRKGLASDK